MKDIGDTELIDTVKRLCVGKATLVEVERVLKERPSAVNIANVKGYTALHVVAMAAPFAERGEAVRLLVEHGANPYLVAPPPAPTSSSSCSSAPAPSSPEKTSVTGGECAMLNAVDLSTEGAQREELVSALLAHRLAHEKDLKSVAPLSASRLMKRCGDDTGTGVFSNVAKHCLYFTYKGAVLMWDVVKDIEHVLYQPREHHPSWAKVDAQLGQFERRRSFVSHGGMDTGFDPSAGEVLEKQLKSIEGQIALVTNFVVTSGLDSQKDPLPDSGVVEWVLCNTGVLLEVHMNRDGPRLRKGTASSARRRKSQVCGGTAEYPEGLSIHVMVHSKGAIRYTKKADAGQVCCAVDGLFGTIAYVVAAKSAASSSAAAVKGRGGDAPRSVSPSLGKTTGDDGPKFGGFNTSKVGEHGDTFLDAFSKVGRPSRSRDVSFGDNSRSKPSNGDFLEAAGSPPVLSPTSDSETPADNAAAPHTLYVSPSDGVVFRVVEFKNMTPKDGFDGCMKSLATNSWDPFDGCVVSEHRMSTEDVGEPLTVLQCRQEFMLLVTQNRVIAADIDPKRRFQSAGYRAKYFELSTVKCYGQFTGAAALAPQRFRPVKPTPSKSYFFATVCTEAVTLYELHSDRSVTPVWQLYPDRVSPHKFTVVFHPAEDVLVLLYQSLQRQEVCTYNLISQKMQAVCKLPKPSSLRFTSQPTAEEDKLRRKLRRQGLPADPDPEVPHLNFALSTNGIHFLRYNVTMHVMSVYSWEEIHHRSETMSYVNAAYTREPIPPVNPRLVLTKKSDIKGSSCVWILAESPDLQRYQNERSMTAASTAVPEGEEDTDVVRQRNNTYVDVFAKQCQEVFQRVAAAFGARVVPFEPAKFVFVAPPEEEFDEEEIAQMERDYYGRMPRHHGVWCAAVVVPLEAVRCAMKMVRELLRAPWDADLILSQDLYKPVPLEYEPKSDVDKKFPSDPDPEATTWKRRGPRLRFFICPGETTSEVHEVYQQGKTAIPRELDGVIIIHPTLRKVLQPLASFFATKPTPTSLIGSALIVVPPELAAWLP